MFHGNWNDSAIMAPEIALQNYTSRNKQNEKAINIFYEVAGGYYVKLF